jgi:ABC-type transporter Mla subunit MlaD
MRVGRVVLAGGLLVACCSLDSPARGSDLSKFLHAIFDDHHNRPPTGGEINYYANVSRTEGPLETYIRMVSSNEYYVTQCQQDAEVYVTRLHQIFLHRDPRSDEVRFWTNQLLQTPGGDRAGFVRQFCLANNVQQVPSAAVPYEAVYRAPTSSSAAADALVIKVALLRNLVEREMGGTRFGRGVLEATASLQSATAQYRDTLNSRQTTDAQLRIAADNLEQALQKLENQFYSVPGTSNQTRNLLWEISQLTTAARLSAGNSPPPVPENPVMASADQVSSLIQQFASLVAQYQNRSPTYASLLRDLNGLFVQVESLRQMVRTSQRASDLQRVTNSIMNQAREITRQISQADMALQQGWWNVQHELDRLASALGCGGDLYADPTHPVVINRPAWNGFPTQVSPGYQASAVNQQVVDLADQLVSTIDDYVNSLRPVSSRSRDVAQMINQTLDLRHDVLVVRQKAAAGGFGTPLQYAARDVTRQYKDVASQTFVRIVGQDPTLNSPAWVRIGELAYSIQKTVGG